jgi:antitoxin (DNA-binding transcriptional repressor) of toxin-antitoxin stability system
MKKTGAAKSIGAAKFKEHCLALLDGLAPEGLIITKHGKPVARVVPLPRRPADLLGVLADKIEVRGDIFSTGVAWESDAQP